ncbi:hypothetical protein AVDCRST_MAG94-2641 [uncultured Leptolyngbya sp.]|uniref:Uncharacterized protein n=1 Tax=uncultured Leptolyngbya sp. TaxID=332963 RepID=A0A6J4M2B5_9CYAN|nr:hypothetical protein AVDCRST_MAG94-2641 [uncultured Leptolyngbya sp.]
MSYIRYVGRNNGNFSRTYTKVASRIRYAGCCIAIPGDCINR